LVDAIGGGLGSGGKTGHDSRFPGIERGIIQGLTRL
jgi:hypothetical protein